MVRAAVRTGSTMTSRAPSASTPIAPPNVWERGNGHEPTGAAGGPGSPIERRGAPLEPSMTIRSGEPPARHGLFQRRGVQAGNVT